MSAAIQYLQEVEWGIWNIETNNKLHFLKLVQWADKRNYLWFAKKEKIITLLSDLKVSI